MTERHNSLIVPAGSTLVGIVLDEESPEEAVAFFVEEDEATGAGSEGAVQDALSLAGAWSDLDWEAVEPELDRIRHQSPPSPPLA